MSQPITWEASEAELQRERIAEWLRELAATASSAQARGVYLFAAEGVERGDFAGRAVP